MPADRDPRTDPRKGDALKKGNTTRTVEARVEETVNWNGNNWGWLSCWREWAKNAEVIHRAE